MSVIAFLLLAAVTPLDADIVNSGSTNTRGYVLHVSRAGDVVVEEEGGTNARKVRIPQVLARRFFAALNADGPLGTMPSRNCPKSKSFGYSVRIKYAGASSPDLTCPASAPASELAALAGEIASAAKVSDRARRAVGP